MSESNGSVLLVGSVPLRSVEEVMEVSARELGSCVRRLPDGEAGGWVNIPAAAIGRSKDFELCPPPPGAPAWKPPQSRLKAGVAPAAMTFTPTGYVDIAKNSYAVFKQLRAAGKIAPGTRFQQSLPTPFAGVAIGVRTEDVSVVMPHFEKFVFAEVTQIANAIPHRDLAIQWDVAGEIVEVLENPKSAMARQYSVDDIAEQLARCCNAIPAEIECGVHLCYGNGPAHLVGDPRDTAVMVDFANRLFGLLRRPLTWLHMPVPMGRDDAAYFAALRGLKRPQQMELYLGLVHLADGVDGARRRIAAAKTAVKSFGVATECGLRLLPPERIPEILSVHRQAASIAA